MFSNVLNVLVQLFLFALVEASPIQASAHGNAMNFGIGGGILGFIVLILDIIVWMEVLQSNRPVPNKILWCVLVFIFPIVGMIIYYLFSNRAAHGRGGYEPIA